MKKHLLSLLAIIAVLFSQAQLTIDSSNAAVVGITTFVSIDTLPNDGVSAGASGSGQVYDISDFDLNIETITPVVEPSTAPGGADFPDADMAFDQQEQGSAAFFTKSASKFEFVGVSFPDFAGGSEPITVEYSDPETQLEFPATLNDGFVDDYYGQESFFIGQEFEGQQIDSGRITIEGNNDALIDGSGRLITIAGEFSNVLRLRIRNEETQTIEACVVVVPGLPCQWVEFQSETTVSVEYGFIGAQSRTQLGGVQYDENETTVQAVLANTDPEITSIAEYNVPTVSGGLYPNPAKDLVTFKGEVTSAYILDINGKRIETEVVNNTIDVSALAAGKYTVIATNAAGFPEQHPLVVSK